MRSTSPFADVSDVADVVVVGGGIAGLTTAFRILQAFPASRVVVFEAAERAGGKVASVEMCGRSIDTGPDAFLARVEGGVELATDLGLGDTLVAPATGRAWLWSRNELHALPAGLVLGVPSDPAALAASRILSSQGLAAACDEESIHLSLSDGDVSVADGIGAHLGAEVVDRLVDPLLGGINASDCHRLSLRSASAELFAAAQEPQLMRALRERAVHAKGQIGVSEERPVFLTPSGGVHQLISALIDRLDVQTGHSVTSVARMDDHWTVSVSHAGDTETVRTNHVVLSTPAFVSAGILELVDTSLVTELASIRTASVALVLFAYPRAAVTLPEGSGMLVARPEGRLMTAASWWNQKWPHLDTGEHVIIRASTGRDGDTRFADMSDDALVDALHEELAEMLSITERPVTHKVNRWMQGFPQYDVGHTARVDRIDALLNHCPGLHLIGASYRGIGLPACIRDANAVAAAICADFVSVAADFA